VNRWHAVPYVRLVATLMTFQARPIGSAVKGLPTDHPLERSPEARIRTTHQHPLSQSRKKTQMTTYSSPELEARAHNIVSLLQAKLAGAGIKSELSTTQYWFTLIVTEDPEVYRAATVSESVIDKNIQVTFESVRMEPDGQALYRGSTMEEWLENFEQEVYEEALKQNKWVKRMHERRAQAEMQRQAVMGALGRLKADLPDYANSIQVTSQEKGLFGLTLTGLTEFRLREIVEAIRKEDSNG
jgi:hypothetical protein